MRVEKISIRNIMGVESLDIAPGAITIVSGKNGSGKTSVLESLRTVIGGGTDATLVRSGQDAGEVVWVLDDGMSIRKRIGKSTSVRVTDGNGKDLAKPQSVIADLLDGVSANPIAFLTAPPSKRAEWLLDAMPIAFTPEEIMAAGQAQHYIGDGELPATLDQLEALRKKVYDDRTGEKRVAKERWAAAAALAAQAPEGNLEAISAELRSAEHSLAEIESALARAESELTAQVEKRRSSLRGEYQEGLDGIRSRYAEQIRELEQQLNGLRMQQQRDEAELQRIGKAAMQQEVDELTTEANKQTAILIERKSQLSSTIAVLAERRAAHTRAEETRRIIAINERQAEAAERQAEAATATIEALDALKQKKLAELPIPGAEVRNGDIYIGGIPFDRLNTAKKVAIALRVAKLRAGKLGLVVVDNLECLDSETFKAFESAAVKSGMQFIVTRVSDGPLKVEVTA